MSGSTSFRQAKAGAYSWRSTAATFADLPSEDPQDGDVAIALDTETEYLYVAGSGWQVLGSPSLASPTLSQVYNNSTPAQVNLSAIHGSLTVINNVAGVHGFTSTLQGLSTGNGLTVTAASGATGHGVSINMAAGSTGNGLDIVVNGSGSAIRTTGDIRTTTGVLVGPSSATRTGAINSVTDGGDPSIVTTAYGVSGATNAPGFRGYSARGTLASPTATQSGDLVGFLSGRGYTGGAFAATSAGRYGIYASEDWSATNQGTEIRLETTTIGTTTRTVRAIVTNGGALVLGPTSTATVPALKPSGTTLQARLGDDSDFAPINVGAATITGTGGASSTWKSSRGSTGSPTAVQSGDILGQLNFQGFIGGTSQYVNFARTKTSADGTVTDATTAPGRWVIATTAANDATFVPKDRWCVDSSGNLKGTSGLSFGWTASSTDPTGSLDTVLMRDAAGILGFSTSSSGASTATDLRIYNSGSSTSGNWERGFLTWQGTANLWQISTSYGGTGVSRSVLLGGNTVPTDVAPGTVTIQGLNAYPQAVTNTTGAALNLAGGLSPCTFTVVDYTLLSGKIAYIAVNGTTTTKTEGATWTAATSNAATATSLASAISAISGVSATAVGAVVYLTPSAGTYRISLDTDAAAGGMTKSIGTRGAINANKSITVIDKDGGGNFQVTSYNAGAGGSNFIGEHARGTEALPTAVQANDFMVQLVAHGYDGSAMSGSKANLGLAANENWAAGTNNGTYLQINLTPNGSTTQGTYGGADTNGFYVRSTGAYQFASSTTMGSTKTIDLRLYRDNAAGRLGVAQNATGSAAVLRVYGTTDAIGAAVTNAEWFEVISTAGTYTVGTNKSGTGTARAVNLAAGGTTCLTLNTDNSVTGAGNISCAAASAFKFGARAILSSSADGKHELTNNAATGYTQLTLGPVVPTGADTAGVSAVLAGGYGTGAGAGSELRLQTTLPLGSSSTVQTPYDRHYVTGKTKALTNNTATTFCNAVLATSNTGAGVTVNYTVVVVDASGAEQTSQGTVAVSITNKAGQLSATTSAVYGSAANLVTGTDAISFGTSISGTTCSIQCTSNTSLTATTHKITYQVFANGEVTLAPQ